MEEDSWSIAVRTVGGEHEEREDFSITINPDDELHSLYHEIEHVTGLKAEQQRLIYRGRLINEKKEPKVRDVVGLCDGQTIHLVPKKREDEASATNEHDPNDSSSGEDHNTNASSSDSVGRSLLATLLGLGSLDEDDDAADESSSPSMRRLRRNRNRRASHRLTLADTVAADPGSMEPVRQGLMTLHTMLDTAQTEQPWDASRQWYRGQWVDCRDTVNQWLEATIVDIAYPDDILPERTLGTTTSSRRRNTRPSSDSAVSANDYEGRRNLLLEPDGQGGFCERHTNHGVHLLLIHYNGWPNRWDEWIRSDSERLRPFRTRTRHNPSLGALPAPQTVFDGAPSTNIKEDDEEDDRAAMLPELSRAMASVHDILQEVVTSSSSRAAGEGNTSSPRPANSDLPWLTDANDVSLYSSENDEPRYTRRQLQTLAPLLDRLGRALTDAAPHVASHAASLPPDDEAFPAVSRTDPENNVVIVGEENSEEPPPPPEEETTTSTTSGGFFSLLSRDRSRSTPERESESPVSLENVDEDEDFFDPDYVDFVNGVVNTTRGETRGAGGRRSSSSDDGASLLGAYLALSSLASEGESNNSTGGGGGGMLGRLLRERGNTNNNDNDGGGGGGAPAIDIHIHAIVTGPGIGPTGAMAMMPGPPALVTATPVPPSTNTGGRGGLFSSRRGNTDSSQRATAASAEDEDMGIFADLYSENPSPLDPNDADAANDAADAASPEEGGTDNERASTNRSSHGRSPSRNSSSNGRSPRRGSTIGRALRGVLGSSSRRRSRNHDDSEAPYEA